MRLSHVISIVIFCSSYPTQSIALPPAIIPRGPQISNNFASQDSNAKKVQSEIQAADVQSSVIRILKSENYDSNLPPFSKTNKGIPIYVRLLIHRIIWFDNQAEAHITLKEEWQDPRLQVPSKKPISFPLPEDVKLWEPDTFFSNGIDTKLGDKVFRAVEESGYIRTNKMRSVKVPFKEESRFPFINRKKFRLRVSSYRYSSNEILYQWVPTLPPVELADQVLSERYKNESYEVQECSKKYSQNSHPCLEINLTFVGPVKQGIFKVFLPSLLLVFASWLHFWINGSWSVPRTLSATGPFFVFVVLLLFFPNLYEDYARDTRTWFITCLLFTFASFVEYFLVICCGMRRTLRYTNGILETENAASVKEMPDSRPTMIRNDSSVDVISRLLFPLLFVIFLAIYLLVQLL